MTIISANNSRILGEEILMHIEQCNNLSKDNNKKEWVCVENYF